MKITQYKHYVPFYKGKIVKDSLVLANALFAELLNYGIVLDEKARLRIASLQPERASEICQSIAAEYTVGALNPPLFKNWESRTFYSFPEFIIQVLGYIFQVSGNDLQDEAFTSRVQHVIDFKKFKTLTLATDEETIVYIKHLFGATVSQDKKTFSKLVDAAQFIDSNTYKHLDGIKSDEARIAALLGYSKYNPLYDSFLELYCKPTDVLKYAAAKNDFDLIKLPAEVKYANLSWSERVASLKYLSEFDFEHLNETFGQNRGAWVKYFSHIHLMGQVDFQRRFKDICLAYYVANGNRLDKAPEYLNADIKSLIKQKVVELTLGGTLAYRTFASRLQTAIDNLDIDALEVLAAKRPNHILRNLTAVANVATKETSKQFLKLIKSLLVKASPDVLFSILSIDVSAKFRIIDVKGDTKVETANYNPVIADIQEDIKDEVYRRWGYKGRVVVQKELNDNIVPFLSKNANLGRGTKFSVESSKYKNNYLYFFVHWIQGKERTDIDLSFLCFNKGWNLEMINFRNQANSYIAHSGDITNAPAPKGATEYVRASLKDIPAHVRYIAPLINVFSGDLFSDNQEVKAGFFTSEQKEFTLSRDHNKFQLDKPAHANIPFIFDVENREIILLDVNIREKLSWSAAGYTDTIKNAIEATKTKFYISIEKFAELLSGDDKGVSLKITEKADKDGEIAPESLFSLLK